MDLGAILNKIKSNIWLIPEKRFDELTKDTDYTDSFIYLLFCMVLSIPVVLIAALIMAFQAGSNLSAGFITGFIGIPAMFIIGIPLQYIGFVIEFALLKLFGGKADLNKSIQVFIYGGTGSYIFNTFPYLGVIPALVSLYNMVIGSARIHQIPLWKAVMAIVVIPIILAVLIAILIAMYLTPIATTGAVALK